MFNEEESLETRWVDLRRGAPGLGGPVLLERSNPYRGLRQSSRLVMLVRGDTPVSFAGGFQRSKHIHLVPVAPSVVLAECALHMQQHMVKLKAGPRPGNERLHWLNTDPLASPSEVARRLYSLVLAPLATAVVFSEGEFGGVDAIIQLLAVWTRCLEAGGTRRYRPRVVVFCSKLACLPNDLESRMTAEILATCNFTREMTTKDAEAKWRLCFSGIDAVLRGLEDEAEVCRQALALSRGSGPVCPPLPGQFVSLLPAACVHFSHNFVRSFDVMRGCRTVPVRGELVRQMGILSLRARAVAGAKAEGPASLIAASALMVDSCHAGLTAFPPAHVFDELYGPLLDSDFVAAVRKSFTAAAREGQNAPPASPPAAAVRNLDWDREDVCLSCLAYHPNALLDCGHRVCDWCVQYRGNGALSELARCFLCGAQNTAPVRAKPFTAGIRALSLAGTDASGIARLLRGLRAHLRSPLYENFDLVIATGVGLFFALMLFCKGASIEECLYHLPNIEYAKENRRGLFKFGRRLVFRREELHSNFVRIIPTPCSPEVEAERLWPGCKVDVVLAYSGGEFQHAQITLAADKLLASLFYIELEEMPEFLSEFPVSVGVLLKCRLPPGPHLADLAARLRREQIRVLYHGEEDPQEADLCPSVAWEDIRDGHPFRRLLYVRALSGGTVITVKVNSTSAPLKYQNASHCPFVLRDLEAAQRACRTGRQDTDPGTTVTVVERINQMEGQLRKLLH